MGLATCPEVPKHPLGRRSVICSVASGSTSSALSKKVGRRLARFRVGSNTPGNLGLGYFLYLLAQGRRRRHGVKGVNLRARTKKNELAVRGHQKHAEGRGLPRPSCVFRSSAGARRSCGITPALRLEPVDHIGIELGVDVGFERQLKHGVGPIVRVGRGIVGIGLGHGLNLRLGEALNPLPVGAVFLAP